MMQAKGLHLGMSLEGNERAGHDHRIDFRAIGPVDIGGKSYICPVHSIAISLD